MSFLSREEGGLEKGGCKRLTPYEGLLMKVPPCSHTSHYVLCRAFALLPTHHCNHRRPQAWECQYDPLLQERLACLPKKLGESRLSMWKC